MDVSPSRVRNAENKTRDSVSKRSPLNTAEQPIKGLLNYSNDTGQAVHLGPGPGATVKIAGWDLQTGRRVRNARWKKEGSLSPGAHCAPRRIASYFPPGFLLCK